MTMLAHQLKQILQLVPEAMPLVKQASVDKEYPLDNKDSTLATALQVKYFEKVAYQAVDFMTLEKIAKAVNLYGIGDQVTDLTNKMVKAAAQKKSDDEISTPENYFLKEASFTGDLGSAKVSRLSQAATDLYKQAYAQKLNPDEAVVLYSGNGYFNKEAAARSLSVRYSLTKDEDFIKVAKILEEECDNDQLKTAEGLVKVANFVTKLDEKNHLDYRGFNFYKETFHVKLADFKSVLNIKVNGTNVPYEKFEKLGKQTISQYMGEDIAKEMDQGPENFKAVVETLPLDLQKVLSGLLKNV
jgi:hypothetical protein